MLRSSRRWGIVAMVLLSSCSGRGASDTPEISRSDELPVQLSVSMRGDVNVDLAQTVRSHFVLRRTASKDPDRRDEQVVGTEPVEAVKVGHAAFVAGIAVLPFLGDGTYTIPMGSPFDYAKAPQGGAGTHLGSSIKVDWWPTGDVAGAPETYMRRAKPCKVVVTNSGRKGTATCPDVTNEELSKHFALTFSWEAPAFDGNA